MGAIADPLHFGVDEAGRGPVIGPMVVAAVAIAEPNVLPQNIADSKSLTPDERKMLAERMRRNPHITIATETIPPTSIDRSDSDLNTLTVEGMAKTVEQIANGDMVGMLDCADPDTERFVRRMSDRLPDTITVRAQHKADERFPVVSAASVVAKVERDGHIADLRRMYGAIGSGYPNDPETRAFLRQYVLEKRKLPPCARASWKTSRDIFNSVIQESLDEYSHQE